MFLCSLFPHLQNKNNSYFTDKGAVRTNERAEISESSATCCEFHDCPSWLRPCKLQILSKGERELRLPTFWEAGVKNQRQLQRTCPGLALPGILQLHGAVPPHGQGCCPPSTVFLPKATPCLGYMFCQCVGQSENATDAKELRPQGVALAG